jgi:P4 family phage/plasmid primase-like protien
MDKTCVDSKLTRGIKLWSHKYADMGFATTGTRLIWKEGRKVPTPRWKWQDATLDNYDKYYESRDNGIMLLTGGDNDIIAIDIDILKTEDVKKGVLDGHKVFDEIIQKIPEKTPIQLTPSGGHHYLFSLTKSIDLGLIFNKSISKLMYKGEHTTIDCKMEGGCIYVYPTKYKKNDDIVRYKWAKNNKIVDKKDLPALPQELVKFLNSQCEKSISKTHNKDINDKGKKIESNDLSCDVFRDRTLKNVETTLNSTVLQSWDRKNGYDVKLEKQVDCVLCGGRHTSNNYMVRQIYRWIYYLKNYSNTCKPNSFNWERDPLIADIINIPTTDAPYVEMIRTYFSLNEIDIVHTTERRWLCFTGHVWIEINIYDITREIDCKCVSIINLLLKNIRYDSEDKVKEKKYIALKKSKEYLSRIGNIKSIVERYRSCYTDVEIEKKMNVNHDLLAVRNGVIELNTGNLRDGRMDDYLSNVLDCDYRGKDHTTDIISSFINDIFNNDIDMIDYMQKLLGYSITGHTNEQVWVIFTGEGSNGKSLLISLIEKLMKPWTMIAPYEVFFKTQKSSGGATPHLTALRKKRIVIKEEAEAGDHLNMELIKMLTGESTITGRGLYDRGFEEFESQCLPILLCNKKPDINVDIDANLRRIIVVPFTNIYTTPEDHLRPYDPDNACHRLKDINKKKTLITPDAQEQLLVWLVQGAIKWYKEGLGKQPDIIKNAFDDYRAENDFLTSFIRDCCIIDKSASVSIVTFRDRLILETQTKTKQDDLKKMMNKRGFAFKRTAKERLYLGITLDDTESDDPLD